MTELGPLPEKVVVDRHSPSGVLLYGWTADQIRAYAAQEVAKERERCAKLADDFANSAWNDARSSAWSDEFEILAAKIRGA